MVRDNENLMIIEFEEKLLELIDTQVENASSDELFPRVVIYVDTFHFLRRSVKRMGSPNLMCSSNALNKV